MLNHFVHDEEVLLLRKTDKPTWTMDSSAKQVEIWYLIVIANWNTNNNSYKFQEIPFVYPTLGHNFFKLTALVVFSHFLLMISSSGFPVLPGMVHCLATRGDVPVFWHTVNTDTHCPV